MPGVRSFHIFRGVPLKDLFQRLLSLALPFLLEFGGNLQAEILPPGHRPEPPGVHALKNARIITKPGTVIENGTIVVRDGRIEKVGADVEAPEEARVWDLSGLTVYAGFIDTYLSPKPSENVLGRQSFDDELQAGADGYNFFGITGQEKDQGRPGPGYALGQVTPEKRVAETWSADGDQVEKLHEIGFTAANVIPEKGVVRGTSAFVLLQEESPNRSILRADVFQHLAFETQSERSDAFPRSIMGAIAAIRQSFLDAQDYVARTRYYEENGEEKHRPDLNLALRALAPAATGKMRVVIEPGSVLLADRAGYVGRELGLDFAILASGQEWRRQDLLEENTAPFIVPLQFPEVPKLPEEEDWAEVSLDQLRAWDWAPENAAVLRKGGRSIALTTFGLSDRKKFRSNVQLAIERGLSEEDALAALTTEPARLCGLEGRLGTIEPGKIANLTVVEGNYFVSTNKVRDVWVNGRVYRVQPESRMKRAELEAGKTKTEQEETAREQKKEAEEKELRNERVARSPMEGRGAVESPPSVVVRGATIWTSAESGRLEGADLLIVDGKIKALGKNLEAPADAAVIDAEGKHVSPGLIDCHSHAMIIGPVNEMTLPSSAMVRIGDVVNSETRRIMEELAGGLTVANLLHGSANPIGGQNCVIKLRDGASPEGMKFQKAPEGIKFALGENVKQGNSSERTTRFPQTRMGVPTFMANRFMAAQQYLQEIEEYEQGNGRGGMRPPPPRRDLELETLGEIIRGERLIHCHSYRQDEIVAFLRVMESFDVQVATLQHVLEGYKVADEIAAHGAGASCFSDWWAYKFEVYDAIPYAGALMHERGVVVSFNSDSADLSRRLYTEAAKAVKYGGLSEEEALKFVTLNPARQLKIDEFVGSLEPGKDADFVIWSRAPLDSRTVCLETWIDGKKYFDREMIAERSRELEEEREKLLNKARQVAGLKKKEPEAASKEKDAFFQTALELRYEFQERHCQAGVEH